MAVPVPSPFSRVWRRRYKLPAILLAATLGLPLGGCSFDLGSWGSDSEKPKPTAERPAGTISAQHVSDAKDRAMRGQSLARAGKAQAALAEFDTALALDPYNIEALYGRGLIYQGQSQHPQAIEDFTAANGLSPQRVEPLLGRATSYLALDKAKEAVADLDEAVQADPNSAAAWTSRGVAYERLGDKTKAAASYGRAVALNPKDEAAQKGLARTGG